MLFAARKEFLPGSFDGAGLVSPAPPKGTPQETFVAQTPRAEVLLILSSADCIYEMASNLKYHVL